MEDNKQDKKGYYDKLTTKELEVLAEMGDSEAQAKLGYRYRYGKKAKTEKELCSVCTMFGCFCIPLNCFFIILSNAFS